MFEFRGASIRFPNNRYKHQYKHPCRPHYRVIPGHSGTRSKQRTSAARPAIFSTSMGTLRLLSAFNWTLPQYQTEVDRPRRRHIDGMILSAGIHSPSSDGGQGTFMMRSNTRVTNTTMKPA